MEVVAPPPDPLIIYVGSLCLVLLAQKLLDSLPCVPFEAPRVVVELFANWWEVSTPYDSFPVGGHIK
jgi:hypothetical protein